MVLRRLSTLSNGVLPGFVRTPVRKLLTGLLTPLRFSLLTGHFKSSLASAAVDRRGQPLPWYTYPAIAFLGPKDFSAKTVLEFGSGHSTLWWAKRARHVVSLESDPKWFSYIRPRMPANARASLIADDLQGLENHLQGENFDVIIIDGLDRLKAATASVELIAHDGAILFDNSEGYWGGDATQEYPILQLFRSRGFSRVDFYGFAPGVIQPHCTSLFFREHSFIIRGEEDVLRDNLPKG